MFKTCLKLVNTLPLIKRLHLIKFKRCFSNLQKPDLLEVPISKALLSKANRDQCVRFEALVDELNELREILNDPDASLESMVKEDLKQLNQKFIELQNDIIESLTRDEYTYANECFLEIKAGVGGQEAMLFAAELFQIYLKYIKWHDWLISSVEDDLSELGGLKIAGLTIKGFQCFKFLRHEAGVHRVQRVPATEKYGRIHTSTVAVGVLPIRHNLVELKDQDLKFETTTSSKPGGQHVNRTETCVRVIHKPTNIQVVSQETRSQAENKERALQRLKDILSRRENELRYNEYQRLRKIQYGDSGRSDKIRTYNVVQDRITDHRLNENMYNMRDFMKGEPERLHYWILKLEEQRKQQMLNHILVNCK